MPYAQRLAKKPFAFRPPRRRIKSAKRLLPKQNGRTFGFSTRQRRSASASRSRPTTAGISRPERPHTAGFRSRQTPVLSREQLDTTPDTSSSNTASSAVSSLIRTDGHVSAPAGGGSATPTRTTRPQVKGRWHADKHTRIQVHNHGNSLSRYILEFKSHDDN